jgi:phenylalanyl-tRNA synthetase beta chain
VLTVTPPPYRFDLQIEEDLIEEVARMVGYNNLPTRRRWRPSRPRSARSAAQPFAVRRSAGRLGYQETINFSFVEESWEHELAGNPNPIKLLNPIASQMSVMRSSLLGSLLQVLKFNLDRKAERVRVFELGRVFLRDATCKSTDTTVEGFHQPMRVAGLAYGGAAMRCSGAARSRRRLLRRQGRCGSPAGAAASPFRAGSIRPCTLAAAPACCWTASHWLCRRTASRSWRQAWELPQAPVLFELELDAVLQRRCPQFQPCPSTRRWSATSPWWWREVTHAALDGCRLGGADPGCCAMPCCLMCTAPNPAQGAVAGAGAEKSLAVRLTLNSDDATLTDEQIEAAVQAVWTNWAEAGRAAARLMPETRAHQQEEDANGIFVESLETPALTKAQLAELLFEQIG